MSAQRALYALTLHRPWNILMRTGIKRIENRRWAPLPSQLQPGDWFALHAGKTWDPDAIPMAQERGVSLDIFDTKTCGVHGVIDAVARFGGVVEKSDDPWFFGPVGWVITEVVPIVPVAARGYQKLWRCSGELTAWVRAEFAKAREGKR